MTSTLMKGAPPGSIGRCHPSGWIQTNHFTEWFNHFVAKAKPTADEPVLLILDGHHSHTKNIEVIEIARIFPLNRQVFSDIDFAPSEETDLTEINLESLKACKGQSVKNKSSNHTISQKTPHATPSISRPVAAIQDLTPFAKDLAEAGPSGCISLVNDGYVSPQDIMLIPKPKKKLSNKGPKPMTCSVVTSSPYKRALEEAQNKKIKI
nr:unnamed protein product [Callosobruchus analis]